MWGDQFSSVLASPSVIGPFCQTRSHGPNFLVHFDRSAL